MPTPATFKRFIDDGFSLSKVNFENSYGFTINGELHRVKHAVQSQNVFRHIVKNATEIGMKVNTEKTTLVCVSDAQQYVPDAFILDEDGGRIGCTTSFKALGVNFSNRLNMDRHVAAMQRGVRSRLWMLRNLKNHGFNAEELLKVYKTMIRPVLDYAAPVFHASLTDEHDEKLEKLQVQALKAIFDARLSGRKLREKAGIETLRSRREELTYKFARKCSTNPRFCHLFPLKQSRTSLRSRKQQEVFLETKARCERLKNSPLHYYRRVLNGKIGKTYGKRYAEYREK